MNDLYDIDDLDGLGLMPSKAKRLKMWDQLVVIHRMIKQIRMACLQLEMAGQATDQSRQVLKNTEQIALKIVYGIYPRIQKGIDKASKRKDWDASYPKTARKLIESTGEQALGAFPLVVVLVVIAIGMVSVAVMIYTFPKIIKELRYLAGQIPFVKPPIVEPPPLPPSSPGYTPPAPGAFESTVMKVGGAGVGLLIVGALAFGLIGRSRRR
ncbi:MAG: hypothetical protein KAS72_07790 [Phycisphaerales bacterium]|nr:hypothetical protein [Phycisphaerales bacterium]